MQRFETPEWPVRPLTAHSWSKSEVELPLLRNTGEGGEGTSPSAGANTNASRSVLPLPSPAPLLRKSTYHHPVSCMNRRHTSTDAGEEGHWVYKGCTALVDLEVPLKLLAKPTHPTCPALPPPPPIVHPCDPTSHTAHTFARGAIPVHHRIPRTAPHAQPPLAAAMRNPRRRRLLQHPTVHPLVEPDAPQPERTRRAARPRRTVALSRRCLRGGVFATRAWTNTLDASAPNLSRDKTLALAAAAAQARWDAEYELQRWSVICAGAARAEHQLQKLQEMRAGSTRLLVGIIASWNLSEVQYLSVSGQTARTSSAGHHKPDRARWMVAGTTSIPVLRILKRSWLGGRIARCEEEEARWLGTGISKADEIWT
ncbi:hypothetical protein B0H14DRAFT_3904875 [Mycena olivaceomarginata]|nr:hypothetical protein B0H14DRAFT_3904875 [Mycena olivaceomarginata]